MLAKLPVSAPRLFTKILKSVFSALGKEGHQIIGHDTFAAIL